MLFCPQFTRLDVLVYADMNSEPVSHFLGFSRLARVQAVFWGNPITTGVPHRESSPPFHLYKTPAVMGSELVCHSSKNVKSTLFYCVCGVVHSTISKEGRTSCAAAPPKQLIWDCFRGRFIPGNPSIDYFISADVLEPPDRTMLPGIDEPYSEQARRQRVNPYK